MADTQRTVAQLQTLLPNNITGAISPQDLRDLLVSLQNDHGEISVTSAAETTIDTVDVWVESSGTWELTAAISNRFSMPVNARLRYDGAETRLMHIACSISVISAGNGKIYEFAIGLGGTPNIPSITRRKIAAGADVGATAVHAFIAMAPGEYLSLMVRNVTDNTNVTVSLSNLFAMGMIM